jgi:hypothetical protein
MESYAQNRANAKRKLKTFHHHHLRIPGIVSPPSSPPERRFLFIALTGELLTNVGPLETGLAKPGVVELVVLKLSLNKERGHIDFTGLSCLIFGT